MERYALMFAAADLRRAPVEFFVAEDIAAARVLAGALMTHGSSFPLGATLSKDGVNFSLFSKGATGVELLFFDRADSGSALPYRRSRSGTPSQYHYWHIVRARHRGRARSTRIASTGRSTRRRAPLRPREGAPGSVWHAASSCPTATTRAAPRRRATTALRALKSVVADPSAYDWEGDRPLQRPFARTVIYEMHVGGFTRHPSSGVAAQARHLCRLIEKIPYLQDLGITAVELLPVFAVRRAGCAAGRVERLGLPAGLVLRAASGATARVRTRSARSTSSATW